MKKALARSCVAKRATRVACPDAPVAVKRTAGLEATLPGSLRANAFLPRFQPPFQCFLNIFCITIIENLHLPSACLATQGLCGIAENTFLYIIAHKT